MAIIRRQSTGAAFTPSGTAQANLHVPTANGSTLMLAVTVRGINNLIAPDATYGEWVLIAQRTNLTSNMIMQLWTSKPVGGCPAVKVTIPSAQGLVGAICVAEYTGVSHLWYDVAGNNVGDSGAITESIGTTRTDNEVWVTAVGTVPQSNGPTSITGGSIPFQGQASSISDTLGSNIELLEKQEPTAGGTLTYSSTQNQSNPWILLTAALIPAVTVNAAANTPAATNPQVDAKVFVYAHATSAPSGGSCTATPIKWRDAHAHTPATIDALATPKVHRDAMADSEPAFGLCSAIALVNEPTLRLDSLLSAVVDGNAGTKLVLLGLFPIQTNLVVRVGGVACLSGVSGRPIDCMTPRADQVICYLPDIKSGVYDVLVSSDTADSQLDQGLTVQQAQRKTSVIAFRQAFSTKWKVGARQ